MMYGRVNLIDLVKKTLQNIEERNRVVVDDVRIRHKKKWVPLNSICENLGSCPKLVFLDEDDRLKLRFTWGHVKFIGRGKYWKLVGNSKSQTMR